MRTQISKTILLTGAGFTKNFGGLIANEMWAKIFNCHEVQKEPVLRNILLNDFDYESIYHKVFDGDDSDDVKEAIKTAILKAYSMLDDIALHYIPATDPSKSEILYGAKKIINHLTWGNSQINFFFTLNQDLFVERLILDTEKKIVNPGIKSIITPSNRKHPLGPNDFIPLPTQDVLDTKDATTLSHKEFHYIKLHGSYGWKSSNELNKNEPNKLVIGRNKERQIANEPLLLWYSDLFKHVLSQGERKLLIIGYGFRDAHINEPIAEAIERYGLKLYIISPTTPRVFKDELIRADHVYGKGIFEGLTGYIKASFKDLFPPDGNDTDAWRELEEIFFIG